MRQKEKYIFPRLKPPSAKTLQEISLLHIFWWRHTLKTEGKITIKALFSPPVT
jgi:hypothetical protein